MKCDIGHFEINAGGRCYNLIPSFKNIMKLGSPTELIELYNSAHDIFNPEHQYSKLDYMTAVANSYMIIRACSDVDPANILVNVVPTQSGLKLKMREKDQVTPDVQLIIAASLLRHGVAGVRKEKQKGSGGKEAKEVDLWEFAHTATAHLGLSKEESLNMTMTEFVRLLDAKYPQEKHGGDSIEIDEYEAAMANLARVNKIRDNK